MGRCMGGCILVTGVNNHFSGDDEQSDWFGGECGSIGRGWWEEEGGDDAASGLSPPGPGDPVDPTFQAILNGSFEHLSEEAKQSYKTHIQLLRQGMVSFRI